MSDPYALRAAGRMLVGGLGGVSEIVSPLDTLKRRPPRRPCYDEIVSDDAVQTAPSTSIVLGGWGAGPGNFPGRTGNLMLAWLVSGTPSTPAGWTQEAQVTNAGRTWTLYSKIAAGDTGVTFTYSSVASASVVLIALPVTGGSFYSAPTMNAAPSNPNTVVYSSSSGTTLDVLAVWIPAGVADSSDIADIPPGRPHGGFDNFREIGGIGADRQTVWIRESEPRIDASVSATTPTINGISLVFPRWRPC